MLKSMMETRKPEWLKINLPGGTQCQTVKSVLQRYHLCTVCDEAHCPNKEECWSRKTATFMILGDSCTRNCRFCAVHSGITLPPDPKEPAGIAEAIALLDLDYAVITCVTRDDLPDGGAAHWAACIREVRKRNPACRIEILISDLQGNLKDLDTILDAAPDVIGHNLETVPRLYPQVRPQADYLRSLEILRHASEQGFISKTGIMLGLGENAPEVEALIRDSIEQCVSVFTIGQYLQPSRKHLPIREYVSPETFALYREYAMQAGMRYVLSGPLVRSSYQAKDAFQYLHAGNGKGNKK
ncbi:MAG: lipoyl synthase [bacterium]|nr:lipoyl synthase [Candidatus Neomarinimicrobiota bacterium]MDD3965539.1 lipoyl synthase [Candidatus Neomarinimicrobiota bacterium]MDX9780814.1 lipoyl synthase [bacterium]